MTPIVGNTGPAATEESDVRLGDSPARRVAYFSIDHPGTLPGKLGGRCKEKEGGGDGLHGHGGK